MLACVCSNTHLYLYLYVQEYESFLSKGERGLGFTVAGGLNTTGYFYVREILFDPALADKRITKGDRLVKVHCNTITDL